MTPQHLKSLAVEVFGRFGARLRHPRRRDIVLAVAAVPALFLLYALLLVPFTPGIGDIRKAKIDQPAQVLSADGKELAVFKRANREWVTLDQVSPFVIDALIATEDHRFRDHFGLDWRRIGGAALRTFSGDRQGGSTITQQLARNLYPDDIGRAPTLTRKLKEAITALKIEALYTKDEILETYLNTVPFLYNAYGIEMAARTYFDKPARRLDVLESATLIGMLKGTSYYNPVLNPERSVQRRNIVLAQMAKRGKLDAAKLAGLQARTLRIDFARQVASPGPAQHFAEYLRKWLIDWADRNGYSLDADGLVVHTTLDARLQTMANQAVMRQGDRLQALADQTWRGAWQNSPALVDSFIRESTQYRTLVEQGRKPEEALRQLRDDREFIRALRRQKTRIEAGFMALDPATGAIRAWVGSRDYSLDAFDHVQQAQRQPGSTFKPFVYGAAFQQGAKPEDTLPDTAVEFRLPGGEIWKPTDGGLPSGQPLSLRYGLAYSKNTITAQLMQNTGPARVAKLAQAMGVRQSRLDAVPSLALGTSPVTLKEMVAAYGTIADGGAYREPVFVTRIEDANGKVLAEFRPARAERVLAPATAYTLLDVMRDVIDRGTGTLIRSRFGIPGDVAGKTGTTQDNADGWFIMMHPQLVAGAWVGFNDARVTLRSDYWGQGAHSALPIVGEVFQRAMRTRVVDAKQRFAEPDNTSFLDPLKARLQGWFAQWFGKEEPAAPAVPAKRPAAPPAPASAVDVPPASEPLPELPPAPSATPDAAGALPDVLPSGPVIPAPPPSSLSSSPPASPAASGALPPAQPQPTVPPATPALPSPAMPSNGLPATAPQ